MERFRKILKYTTAVLLMGWILFLTVFGSSVEIRADEESTSSSSSSKTGQSLYDALKAIYGDSSSSSSSGSSSNSSTTSSSSQVTVEQMMKRMETEPIGPSVIELIQ